MGNISNIMIRDHVRIREILNSLESVFRTSPENIKGYLNKFKWNLEKHFFIEEKVIFSMLEISGSEEISNIFDLMKQHGEIIELIKDLENNLKNKIDFSIIKEKLTEHLRFEENFFYPKLDDLLDENQKKEICTRIEEIIIR